MVTILHETSVYRLRRQTRLMMKMARMTEQKKKERRILDEALEVEQRQVHSVIVTSNQN